MQPQIQDDVNTIATKKQRPSKPMTNLPLINFCYRSKKSAVDTSDNLKEARTEENGKD